MKNIFQRIILSVIVILLVSCFLHGQIKIMPLGDSITEGIDFLFINMEENEGYRKFLKDTLDAEGYNNIDFVGSESNGTAGFIDKEHEGHPAWKAYETIAGTFAGGGIAKEVKNFLQNNPADIVLLHIGTNDISFDWNSTDVVDHVNDVGAILDSIYDFDSSIIVILAKIVNRADSGSNRGEPNDDNFLARVAATSEFNDSLAAKFPESNTLRIVDMENALVYPDDINTDDGGSWWLHPTPTGYRKMAAVWFYELQYVIENILPVELTSFTGFGTNSGVTLNWKTATEVNNFGFEIERKLIENKSVQNSSDWETIGFVEGYGNSNSPKSYSFLDKSLVGSNSFYYRLKQIDNDGQYEYSQIIEVELTPNEFELKQNYPNPFNPATTIEYYITEKEFVNLSIFNSLGEKVRTLVNKEQAQGNYKIEFNAGDLSSGVYYYKIAAGTNLDIKKLVLLK